MEINQRIQTGIVIPPPLPGGNLGIPKGSDTFPALSKHAGRLAKEIAESEETADSAEDLNLDSYEITRGEFFAHQREPSFIFNDGKVGVNTACVRKLEDVEYVQILINREKKKLAVRACQEDDIYSLQWGNTKNGKRFPRQITGRIFFMKVCELMNWNPDFRYKILGKLVQANNERIFLFDLTSHETFPRIIDETGKKKSSRKPVYQEEWKHQFGIPFSEHKKALQLNLFGEYTVLSVADRNKSGTQKKPATEASAE